MWDLRAFYVSLRLSLQNATLTCRRLTQKRATARFAVALEGAET
jgi:hypothetical protein